jgi:hypothetical protein
MGIEYGRAKATIMKCSIFTTEAGEQVLAGTIKLKNGRIKGKAVNEDYQTLIDNVLSRANLIEGGTRSVTAESDPQLWFESLPDNWNGTYVRAEIKK